MNKKMIRGGIAGVVLTTMLISLVGCSGKAKTLSEDAKPEAVKQEVAAETTTEAKRVIPNFNETGYPIVNEPITVGVTGRVGVTQDWQQTIQMQEIEKRFGIKLDCEPFPNDTWKTQLTLMLTTDSLPDMILNADTSVEEIGKYGEQGYYLPINQYLDYAPNLAKVFEEYPAYKSFLTSPDGNIYGLSRLNMKDNIGRTTRTFLNKKWLENLGLEEPQTIDELYNVLRAFKEKDANGNGDPNDEIPMAYNDFYWQIETTLLAGFGINTFAKDYILAVDNNGALNAANTSDNYKEYLKFMNKLYSEGLMDQHAFIQTKEELEAKGSEDRIGLFGCPSAPYVMAKKERSYDWNWTVLAGMTQKLGDQRVLPLANPVIPGISVVLNANTEYPEALVRLLDFFYTEEGGLAGTHGFEGESFEFKEIEGVPGSKVATPFSPEGYSSPGDFRTKKGVVQGAFWLRAGLPGYANQVIRESDDDFFNNVLLQGNIKEGLEPWAILIEKVLRNKDLEQVEVIPHLVYTSEENAKRATLITDITTYIATAKAQFITGEVSLDSGWNDYISTLEQMGLKDLLAIEQAAYDRQ